MWQKITNEKHFMTGKILIEYPVIGIPVDKLDLSDIKNIQRFEIDSVNQSIIDLKIPDEDIPNPAIIKGMPHVTGIIHNLPSLHKSKSEFIKEEKWWFEV